MLCRRSGYFTTASSVSFDHSLSSSLPSLVRGFGWAVAHSLTSKTHAEGREILAGHSRTNPSSKTTCENALSDAISVVSDRDTCASSRHTPVIIRTQDQMTCRVSRILQDRPASRVGVKVLACSDAALASIHVVILACLSSISATDATWMAACNRSLQARSTIFANR